MTCMLTEEFTVPLLVCVSFFFFLIKTTSKIKRTFITNVFEKKQKRKTNEIPVLSKQTGHDTIAVIFIIYPRPLSFNSINNSLCNCFNCIFLTSILNLMH